MMTERPLFILAGNSPYLNRGCEAIVRGTVSILRKQYDNPQFICISHFSSEEEFKCQQKNEIDDSIQHLSSYRLNRHDAFFAFYKPRALRYTYHALINKKRLGHSIYGDLLPHLPEAKAVLSVGGDNYSLDYGKPDIFTALDEFILDKGKPLIIWGASVGPFGKMPSYERYMYNHLKKVTGIFARESGTIDYLKGIGIKDNVYNVADPAFAMEPSKPNGIETDFPINREAIGLNFSPLMATYVTGGDLRKWSKMVASIIEDVGRRTELPIFLIPHVTVPLSNDYLFMKGAFSLVNNKNSNVVLLPPKYNAAETKWIISKMTIFAGARTHSTIASLSSGVPTLSMAYSIKAVGINRDLFGHTHYCIGPKNVNSSTISAKIVDLLENDGIAKRELVDRLPSINRAAMNAGAMLNKVIDNF
jgi:polysaccharide pyruvyl transferase WcaK-like protein